MIASAKATNRIASSRVQTILDSIQGPAIARALANATLEELLEAQSRKPKSSKAQKWKDVQDRIEALRYSLPPQSTPHAEALQKLEELKEIHTKVPVTYLGRPGLYVGRQDDTCGWVSFSGSLEPCDLTKIEIVRIGDWVRLQAGTPIGETADPTDIWEICGIRGSRVQVSYKGLGEPTQVSWESVESLVTENIKFKQLSIEGRFDNVSATPTITISEQGTEFASASSPHPAGIDEGAGIADQEASASAEPAAKNGGERIDSGGQGRVLPLAEVGDTVWIALSSIEMGGGTQSRAGFNEETLQSYVEAWESGVVFPPIELYFDGQSYWLADGFHRVASLKKTSFGEQIEAIVRQGTRRDAVLHSVGANAKHGLQRTNADKHRAVETLLKDEEWGKWSDREIARRCGVGNRFVGDVRRSLCPEHSENGNGRTYATKHGTTAQMRTENIGSNRDTPQGGLQVRVASPCNTPPESDVWQPKERDRVIVSSDHPLYPGATGRITGLPGAGAVIVQLDDALDSGRERIELKFLSAEGVEVNSVVPAPAPEPSVAPPLPVVDSERSVRGGSSLSSSPRKTCAVDGVASEIALGLRHLSPEQIAWTVAAAADAGLSDECLKAMIKSAKRSLNERHHPSYANHE